MKVAAVQMTTGPQMEENFEQAEKLIRLAALKGAKFVSTPEVTDQILADRAQKIDQHFTQEDHPGLPFFSKLAKELNITLLIGSMCVRLSEDKLANRSFLFAPDGTLKATYDKIHMFDVDLPTGESYRESTSFRPGSRAVMSDISETPFGLAICYDMRFPHLFRHLAKSGALIISAPSAFSVPTGKAHWHVLLRARAIETGCFIIAAAQVGDHASIRQTYGHSLIVAPWGEILAEATEDKPDVILADLDLGLVEKARYAVPAIHNDQDYAEIPAG